MCKLERVSSSLCSAGEEVKELTSIALLVYQVATLEAGGELALTLESEETKSICDFEDLADFVADALCPAPTPKQSLLSVDLLTQPLALLSSTSSQCSSASCAIDPRCPQAFTTAYAQRCQQLSSYYAMVPLSTCNSLVSSNDAQGRAFLTCALQASGVQQSVISTFYHNQTSITPAYHLSLFDPATVQQQTKRLGLGEVDTLAVNDATTTLLVSSTPEMVQQVSYNQKLNAATMASGVTWVGIMATVTLSLWLAAV